MMRTRSPSRATASSPNGLSSRSSGVPGVPTTRAGPAVAAAGGAEGLEGAVVEPGEDGHLWRQDAHVPHDTGATPVESGAAGVHVRGVLLDAGGVLVGDELGGKVLLVGPVNDVEGLGPV